MGSSSPVTQPSFQPRFSCRERDSQLPDVNVAQLSTSCAQALSLHEPPTVLSGQNMTPPGVCTNTVGRTMTLQGGKSRTSASAKRTTVQKVGGEEMGRAMGVRQDRGNLKASRLKRVNNLVQDSLPAFRVAIWPQRSFSRSVIVRFRDPVSSGAPLVFHFLRWACAEKPRALVTNLRKTARNSPLRHLLSQCLLVALRPAVH